MLCFIVRIRLLLPGPVKEDGDYINFKLESGDMFVTMTKMTPGEHFEDLDLLSKLIISPSSVGVPSKNPIILADEPSPEDETHYDWFLKPSDEITTNGNSGDHQSEVDILQYPYGFAASKSGLLHDKVMCNFLVNLIGILAGNVFTNRFT